MNKGEGVRFKQIDRQLIAGVEDCNPGQAACVVCFLQHTVLLVCAKKHRGKRLAFNAVRGECNTHYGCLFPGEIRFALLEKCLGSFFEIFRFECFAEFKDFAFETINAAAVVIIHAIDHHTHGRGALA
jgi:hypothetical protein